MEGHGRELSPLDRSRLLASGHEGGAVNNGDAGGSGGGAGSGPSLTPTASEYSSRTATPTPLTSLAAQYSGRYGLPPALPAHSYTLMSSFLNGAHSAEARKSLLPEFQHYWGEGVQRYLMSGLYSPYPPLFPPTAESLSLLGAGSAGAAPAPAHHSAHYQRLLEMQKAEAYIASMSAAASHHPALYALPPSALPQFVEPPLPLPVSSSTVSPSASSSSTSPATRSSGSIINSAPLSLVKQEPRDLSCAEKVAKQSERRAMGVKVDLDQHHSELPASSPSVSGGAGAPQAQAFTPPLKEPKLSPSAPPGTPSKHDRRSSGAGGRGTPSSANAGSGARGNDGSSGNQVLSKPASLGALTSSELAPGHREEGSRTPGAGSNSRRSATPAPSLSIPRSVSSGIASTASQSNNISSGRQTPKKSGKSPASSSRPHKSQAARSAPASPGALIDRPVPSVPTKLAPPIALATVQHDGVVLSALASPSSAAASSVAAKTFVVKQGTSRSMVVDDAEVSGGALHSSPNPIIGSAHSSNNASATSTTRNSLRDRGAAEAKSSSDDNSSDIVVDSTESDDVVSSRDAPPLSTPRAPPVNTTKSERERAIEETIQRVVANEDGADSADNDAETPTGAAPVADRLSTFQVTRAETPSVVMSSGSSNALRTVYAKTQCVPSLTAPGSIPVGIAVAQIRPHHVHQPRDHVAVSGVGRDHGFRHASPTGANRPKTQTATPLQRGGNAQQNAHSQAHAVSPSTLAAAGSSPRYPVSAPTGFKFSMDPGTGQVFLVHCEDVVDRPGEVWPVAAPPLTSPSGVRLAQARASSALPTVIVHSPEPRQEQATVGVLTDVKKDTHSHEASQRATVKPQSHRLGMATNIVTSSVAHGAAPELGGHALQVAQSRGSSPILFDDLSSPLSLLSALSSLSSKKPTTCNVGIQAGESLGRVRKRRGSPSRHASVDRSVQTLPLVVSASSKSSLQHPSSSSSLSGASVLNPLSVDCPSLEQKALRTQQPLEVKVDVSSLYNPFTDPQILQAAHGLELLSTLAEKRPKCSSSSAASSLDDPKQIYPSPSDSFDTLSPTAEQSLEGNRSGQGSARREVRRELSPKWTRPKKEQQDSPAPPGDFKPPPDLELPDDLDVRVKLVEVQRQYKEKQRELAKLQSKKIDASGIKSWKRGPGRPPKKKTHFKKSDDDSSSSSSKCHHPQPKKKRPTEELVDRIYRKLAPDKPNKVSRSIHYVKSKTGPFFRRKSASKSVKRNKDLFGVDPSAWPSFSERKHQEKVRHSSGKDKYKTSFIADSESKHKGHFSLKSKGHKTHIKDTGNIFSNLQKSCESGEYNTVSSPVQPAKAKLTMKAKPGSDIHISPGILASSASPAAAVKPGAPGPSIAVPPPSTGLPSTSSLGAFSISSTPGMGGICGGGQGPLYNRHVSPTTAATSNNSAVGAATFGSMSTLMSGAGVSFFGSSTGADRSTGLASSSGGESIATTTSSSTINTTTTTVSTTAVSATTVASFPASTSTTPCMSGGVTTTTSAVTAAVATPLSPLFPGNRPSFAKQPEPSSLEEEEGSSASASHGPGSSSTSKRKADDDSDTDASETSPNKKRKPGRPRKIHPEKSSGGTETIWAKKSHHMQSSESLTLNDSRRSSQQGESDSEVPLFNDEWNRRRSERIFLSEANPQAGPSSSGQTGASSSSSFSSPSLTVQSITPSAVSPRAHSSEQHVWKLSHFMPKSKKLQEASKPQAGSNGGESSSSNDNEKKDDAFQPLFSGGGKRSRSSEGAGKKAAKQDDESFSPSAELSSGGATSPSVIISTPSSSSLTSPSPPKSKRGRKPKDDKAKVKKSKEKKSSTSPSPPVLVKKERQESGVSKLKKQKAKSLHNITQRVKKKFSKSKKQGEESNGKGRPRKDKEKTTKFDPLESEGPPTPEPRCCKLQTTDLREGLKVLYLNDGLFYEGTVKALQPPDVYGVLTAGQRGSRPHILCQEQVLKDAVLDVRPGSKRYLPVGTRVCAFWSQQFSCLYPGTVAKSPSSSSDSNTVSVDFDDEDSGRIPIEHIRLLPSDFPIIEYEPNPLENLPKRRKTQTQPEPADPRPSRGKRRTDESDEDDANSDEEQKDEKSSTEDSSDSTDSSTEILFWRWHGPPIRKPGQKGKLIVKGKRVYYKSIVRASEVINVGDAAIFVTVGRLDCPYIGNIENLWETAAGNMKVKVRWYYHAEETQSNKKVGELKNALFTSPHMDENDVQTIAQKCEVMTPAQFRKRGQPGARDAYYCAGHYDPVSTALTLSPGVL